MNQQALTHRLLINTTDERSVQMLGSQTSSPRTISLAETGLNDYTGKGQKGRAGAGLDSNVDMGVATYFRDSYRTQLKKLPWSITASRHVGWCGLIAFSLFTFGTLAAQTEQQPTPSASAGLPSEATLGEGVTAGKIEGPFTLTGKIYPGTEREYWVYVPAGYDKQKPACVLIVQDGLRRAEEWHLPTIMDNLIHHKEMPVTIGIFVNPGVVPASKPNAQPRFNRSLEYDSLGDRYARFLTEELLPEVGKSYSISAEANDRCLAGASSGGICAFNAAWEKPDAFRRVISTIGTYVGLRGGNEFPMLVRKTEPKPLRVFLEDGNRDLNIYAGDWWIANQDMASALRYAGYEVEHAWGEGGHDGKHASSVMPHALRWIWKDYPQPILAGPNATETPRVDILVKNSGWELVSSGHETLEAPVCNAAGELFFCDPRVGRIYRSSTDGKTRVFADQTGRITGMAFGPDGKLYACQQTRKRIVRYLESGAEEVVIPDVPCQDILTLPSGFYFSDTSTPALWWSDYSGKKRKVDELAPAPVGLAITGDHAFLHVSSMGSRQTISYRVAGDGVLEHRQTFGFLHCPVEDSDAGAGPMVEDREGRLYVATKLGVQVLDQLGRCNWILARPDSERVTGVAFGGAEMDTLFITVGERVYKRKLKTRGAQSQMPPIELPKPGL